MFWHDRNGTALLTKRGMHVMAPVVLFFWACGAAALIRGPNYDDIRALAMGNASVAVTTDRTAIFHNPAGLSLLRDKVEFSVTPVVASMHGNVVKLFNAMKDQGSKLNSLGAIDQDFIDMVNDLDGEWYSVNYLPEVTVAGKNIGFGFYSVWPVTARIEGGHLIPKLGIKGQRDLVFTWAVGIPLQHEDHYMGISMEYVQRTPVEETITTYTETFDYFKSFKSRPFSVLGDFSSIQHGVSFDIGFMHNFGGFRLAHDVKDIFGVIGGELVVPPQVDVGCSYFFPQMEKVPFIDNLILAMEFSDVFGLEPDTEKYEQFWKKTHLGFEIDMRYVALRAGLNQGYATAGVGLRVGTVWLDYVFFTEEVGYYAGQSPDSRHVLGIGFGFKVKAKESDVAVEVPQVPAAKESDVAAEVPQVPAAKESDVAAEVPQVPAAAEPVETGAESLGTE